ncbi:hypothetical protein QTP88_009497 [Uroleucon formosanum]
MQHTNNQGTTEVFTMEKNNQKNSVLENSKNSIFEYTIEVGNTTYKNTLEDRIQAAKNASSSAKLAQKQNINDKSSKSRNAKEYINIVNMPVKKSMSSAQELKITNKQWASIIKTDIQTSTHIPLPKNLTKTKNINSNFDPKCNLSPIKSTYKGSCPMQLRLEAIKTHKKLSNRTQTENVTLQDIPLMKNHSSKLCNTNNFKRNEYKTRSTVQKHLLEEVKYTAHCDRTKDITNTPYKSVTSVQNRLMSAREQMIAKSKDNNEFNISKCGIIKKPSTYELDNIHHNTNTLCRNNKNKTKRLNQPNPSIKKKTPGIVSTTKKIISNNYSSVNKCIDQRLMNVQQKPIVPILNNMIPSGSSASETIVSTKHENQCILTNSKFKELDSFSFVRPQTSCNQRTFEIKKNTQFNNDEIMEWEDIIETDDIVEKVNNLRKIKHEYEPMEWTPDSIMHSDRINYCLVVDTNILLSDLKSITILIDRYLTDYGYPTVVLPWQVLKELDCIKNCENALGYRAREATRWLLDMLSKHHPRLKGQPMTKKLSLSSDDDILKCAITVKERVNIVVSN